MPLKIDKIPLNDPFLDRRCKLIPCQREMVKYWYDAGKSITSIAKLFGVNKRLIQFTLFPDRAKKNLELRADRGGSKIYYNREKHSTAVRELRIYKRQLNMKLSDVKFACLERWYVDESDHVTRTQDIYIDVDQAVHDCVIDGPDEQTRCYLASVYPVDVIDGKLVPNFDIPTYTIGG